MRQTVSDEVKNTVGKNCCNCGASENIEYHHIVPLFLGGKDVITNIVASMIAEKCVGMIFRPFESQCPTDVALEAGDTITIEDRNGNLYNTYLTTTTLQPGSGQKIACNAKSAAKNSTVRYGQLTQAYVEARKLVKKEQTARERAIQKLEESLSIGTAM